MNQTTHHALYGADILAGGQFSTPFRVMTLWRCSSPTKGRYGGKSKTELICVKGVFNDHGRKVHVAGGVCSPRASTS
jgi:hypothetical protein